MFDAAILDALARAVAAGDEAAAWRALDEVDPLVRGRARRRLLAAWQDASAVAGQGAGARHVLSVAYLKVARVSGPVWADATAVAAAYAGARRPAERRGFRRWPSAAAATVVVGLAALLVGAVVIEARRPARADASRRAAPAATGAYARGGVPVASPALARALGEDLPAYVVALDEWVRAEGMARLRLEPRVARAAGRVLAADVRAALGARGSERLAAVLLELRAAAAATPASAAAEAARRLLAHVGAFDDELAARDLAYYLDGDLVVDRGAGGRHVVLYAYRVVEVRIMSVDGRPLRALGLSRLDRLNAATPVLGFSRPHLREALVVHDELDESLVALLLPALAPEAPLVLTDEDADLARSPWSQAVRAKAGAVVRAELGAALGPDATAAGDLGATLARRHALIAGWREQLEEQGYTLVAPRTLGVPARFRAALEGLVPAAELAALDDLAVTLAEPEAARLLGAAREVWARSVRRHEAQHRADYARGEELAVPDELLALMGPRATRAAGERAVVTQARDELSAYLAELARDRVTPRTNLLFVARFVLDRRQWGGPEHYAALVILDGLAAELGLPPARLLVDGKIHRPRVGELVVTLLDTEPARLRAAARRLWERLFAAPLAEMTE